MHLPDATLSEELYALRTDSGRYGFIGEIFSSFQGEGPYVGRRQIFIRLAGCELGCTYCDTSDFRKPADSFRVEHVHGSGEWSYIDNPASVDDVIGVIKLLHTPDVHSISITGGEPLIQPEFLEGLAVKIKDARLRLFLETSGCDHGAFMKVLEYTDIASIDVKLPSHKAVRPEKWEVLYENELACVQSASSAGIETVVKVVITGEDDRAPFERLCDDLQGSGDGVWMVIQPVTPPDMLIGNGDNDGCVSPSLLFSLSETAAGTFKEGHVMVLPQMHRMIGVL